MQNLLKKKLESSECFVEDISGGCGSMYAIKVKSAQFNGQLMFYNVYTIFFS